MAEQTQQVVRGARWIYLFRWTERLLGFVSLVVLARLLTKADFGLVAMATGAIAVIEGLSEFDLKSVLIRTREPDRQLFDTAWSLAILRGLFAAAVLGIAGAVVSDADLSNVLFVIAVVPVLDGIANPKFMMFERQLDYSKVAVQVVTAAVVGLIVTIAVALLTRDYWALVAGAIATSVVRTALSYGLQRYRPKPTLARVREIFAFSSWMALANIVSTLSQRSDRIVVGGLLGSTPAGGYFMTQRISVLPTAELISPLQRILFPALSRIIHEPERLKRATRESVGILSSISIPVAFGFALVANDFVPIALGERWSDLAPLLSVLVPVLGLRAALSSGRPCVLAQGRTQLLFRASWVYSIVHLPVFVGCTAAFGLEGAIWSLAGLGFWYVNLNAWLLREAVGLRWSELLEELRRPVLAGLAMVLGMIGIERLTSWGLFDAHHHWASLAIKVAAGGLIYAGVLELLWRRAGRPPGPEERVHAMLRRA